jgi:DNA-binding protein YbaB
MDTDDRANHRDSDDRDSDDWAARLRDDTLGRLAAVARMQQELGEVHGEGAAAAGLVRARVTPAGTPIALHLAPAALRMRPDELSGHVLAAMGEAAAVARRRVAAVVGEVVAPEALDALLRGSVPTTDRSAVGEELDRWRPGGHA